MMIRSGDMVIGNNVQMKVGIEYGDFICCVWFDFHGTPRRKWFHRNEVVPLRYALQPRSCWPEVGDLERRIAENEEREARAAEKAQQKAARKARRRGYRKTSA